MEFISEGDMWFIIFVDLEFALSDDLIPLCDYSPELADWMPIPQGSSIFLIREMLQICFMVLKSSSPSNFQSRLLQSQTLWSRAISLHSNDRLGPIDKLHAPFKLKVYPLIKFLNVHNYIIPKWAFGIFPDIAIRPRNNS
jgi:hypothetical protein